MKCAVFCWQKMCRFPRTHGAKQTQEVCGTQRRQGILGTAQSHLPSDSLLLPLCLGAVIINQASLFYNFPLVIG